MNSNESKAAKFRFELLHPKHWPIWLAFGLWRFITILPFPILLMMGKVLGLTVHSFSSKRKHIAKCNIEICFPDKTIAEKQKMLRDNFISMGIAIMETGMAWWWSKRRLAKLIKYDGLEHLDSVNPGQGIILLGIHYTTLEIGGGAISMAAQMDGMYRAHGNPVYDFIQVRGRASKGAGKTVLYERRDVRGTMKALKKGRTVWYGPDQDYGLVQGLFAPFFGVKAATVYGTARFAKVTGAAVIPVSHVRLEGSEGYQVTIYPSLEEFPAGDDLVDATRINQIVEKFILLQPDQYLWAHRRFKNRPEGEPDLYNLPAKRK